MVTGLVSTLINNGISGLLFFLAGAGILMGIITAEIFFPAGYSTAESEISDLGATRPPDSIIYQPSASIFNLTMILGGLLIILASVILVYERAGYGFTIFPLFLGIGILGVGIFPGNNAFFHPLFALLSFISGGLSAIMSWRVTAAPLNHVFGILGVMTLVFLLSVQVWIPILGDGGTERFVAFPVIIWLIGFGAYRVGARTSTEEIPVSSQS